MDSIIICVEFFMDDFTKQHQVINVELLKYKKKEGVFGRPLANAGCAINDDNYDPSKHIYLNITYLLILELTS